MLMRIWLLNDISIRGIDLGRIQSQILVLQNENLELRAELYQEESLTTISEKAKQMGFVVCDNCTIYLDGVENAMK